MGRTRGPFFCQRRLGRSVPVACGKLVDVRTAIGDRVGPDDLEHRGRYSQSRVVGIVTPPEQPVEAFREQGQDRQVSRNCGCFCGIDAQFP